MPPPKTHEQNLASICAVCGRKGDKFQNIAENSEISEKVKLLQPDYNRQSGIHPTVICSNCRNACRETEKNPEQTRYRVKNLLDYSALRPPSVSTRGNPTCSCSICCLGKMDVNAQTKYNKKLSNPRGRPARKVEMMKTDDATSN